VGKRFLTEKVENKKGLTIRAASGVSLEDYAQRFGPSKVSAPGHGGEEYGAENKYGK